LRSGFPVTAVKSWMEFSRVDQINFRICLMKSIIFTWACFDKI
jgi:hypothetical protein